MQKRSNKTKMYLTLSSILRRKLNDIFKLFDKFQIVAYITCMFVFVL